MCLQHLILKLPEDKNDLTIMHNQEHNKKSCWGVGTPVLVVVKACVICETGCCNILLRTTEITHFEEAPAPKPCKKLAFVILHTKNVV